MTERNRDIFIKGIFASIAYRIDFLSSMFSLGLDDSWRRKLVSVSGLRGGEKVLDVCTGTGKLALLLSKKVGHEGSICGVDFSEEMLRIAQQKIDSDLSNISYVLSDAKNLPFSSDSFDAVTYAFGMRNIPDTITALAEAYRVLKPGGSFLCLELTTPSAHWFQPIYTFYCFRIMPLIGKMVVKSDIPYRYLPRSIESFSSHGGFKGIMEKCGFSEVTVYPMTLGVATIYKSKKAG